MKFFFLSEKTFKNNLYLDYFFKNFLIFFYKKITGNNFLYLIDKYLTEIIFFQINSFFKFFYSTIFSLRKLNFSKILQITLILIIQLTLVFYL